MYQRIIGSIYVAVVIEESLEIVKERKIGNLYGFTGDNYAGNVYDQNGLSPCINTMQGGNKQPMIVAMRGRNPDNPSDRASGIKTE